MFWKHNTVNVKNSCDGHVPDTCAKIIVQNKLSFSPKVSVIIPVHNAVKYIKRSLNSAINQTLREIEIICVDDGSTDLSLAILIEYAKKDPRITVLAQKNLFAGIARNAGLAIARGEYLAFLDSDDYFDTNMLQTMYEAAIKNDADIALCGADAQMVVLDYWFNGHSVFSCQDDHIATMLFQCIEGYPWNKLYRTKMTRDNNFYFSNSYRHNDTAFVMASLIAANKIVYVKEKFVHYEYNANSITRNNTYTKGLYISIVDLYNNIKTLPNFEKVKKSYSDRSVGFTMATFFSFDLPIAKHEIREHLKKIRDLSIFDVWAQTTSRSATLYALDNIMTTIPVVIQVTRNDIDNTIKTIESCVNSTGAFVDFYLITPSPLKKQDIRKIQSVQKTKDCEINFVKPKDLEPEWALPKTILNKYTTCIKIEPGININQNLYDLFQENMEGFHIAATACNSKKNSAIKLYNLTEIQKSKNVIKTKKLPLKYNICLRNHIKFIHDLIMHRYELYPMFYNTYSIPDKKIDLTEKFYI